MAANGAVASGDASRWHVVYPIYLNSKKTLAEGRRLPASKAVENPTLLEICDCLNYLKVPFQPEPMKGYSRDFLQRGRVRVQLKRSEGNPINPAIPDKKALLLKLANLIPKHQGRTKKQEQPAATNSAGSVSEKKGKGGKKKK
eukprot:jgi/Mesen1/2674/ME000167S01823